ncbi:MULTISPECIES: hypothetical protein [unclassified Acinetobacter]|uniref:hypothetical protein n=1 Tax=unclassified Acinetobacter TaxID=196816 RepID=UPI0015D456B8|nr:MULTISPECIES: hypothetical protein [unclassified Acinetobacter]
MPASIYSVPESVSGTWERIFRGIGVMDIKEVVKTAILRNSHEWGDEQAEAVLKAINEAGFLVVPAKAQAVPEWINVNLLSPQVDTEVLVCVGDDVKTAIYRDLDGEGYFEGVFGAKWWMPKPKAQEPAND